MEIVDSHYFITNSFNFDVQSIIESYSSLDFWNGLIKEDNKIYNQYKRDELSRTFYRTPRWIETRKKKLHMNPFCEECQKNGTMVVGKIVDHIVPIKQGGEPYDLDNLQTLCWSCHSRKSVEEGSRFGVKKY